MIPEALGRELHDRSTRGERLSGEEEVRLQEWYAQWDQKEQMMLKNPALNGNLRELRAQVATVLSQLVAVSQRIDSLAKENEALRQEVSTLYDQLHQRSTQSA